MPVLIDDKDKIISPNEAWVLSVEEGLHYLQQLKESGEELDPNGNLKQSLDVVVVGGLPDDIDGAIDSLERKIESEKKVGDEQISKDKLDELVAEYEEAKAKGEENEATLKEIQRILDEKPSLADENIRRFVEAQNNFRNEKIKVEAEKITIETTVEEGVVIDEKVKDDVKLVKGKIQELSKKVVQETGGSEVDKEAVSRVEIEMKKIMNGTVKTNEEKINDLMRAVTRGEISQLEYKVKIKKITLELEKWTSENRKEVDNYLTEEFVEKVKKENGGVIKKEQEESARIIKNLSNKVIHLDNEIKDQEESILENNGSSGQTQNTVNTLKVMAGYMRMYPEDTKDTLKKVREAELKLGGLKIPNDGEVEAFGRVSAELRKDEKTRNALERIQRKKLIFGKTKANFYQFVSGQKRIWNEQTIKKSISVLMGNNLGDAMERIYIGINSGGIKMAPMGTNEILSGSKNISTAAGSFLKKSFGDLGSKLGPGIRKGIGNGINAVVRGGLKVINNFPSIGGFKVKAVVAISGGVLVAIIVGSLFFANQQILGPGFYQGATEWMEGAVE